MRLLVIGAMLMLTACSSSQEAITDSNNIKVMGRIVSVTRTSEANVDGAGNVASSSASRVANALTGGVFSEMFGGKSMKKGDLNAKEGRIYAVRTDDGQLVKVTIESERIFFPGEEVIIIRNEDGFESIYPRDLHGPHPGGL